MYLVNGYTLFTSRPEYSWPISMNILHNCIMSYTSRKFKYLKCLSAVIWKYLIVLSWMAVQRVFLYAIILPYTYSLKGASRKDSESFVEWNLVYKWWLYMSAERFFKRSLVASTKESLLSILQREDILTWGLSKVTPMIFSYSWFV